WNIVRKYMRLAERPRIKVRVESGIVVDHYQFACLSVPQQVGVATQLGQGTVCVVGPPVKHQYIPTLQGRYLPKVWLGELLGMHDHARAKCQAGAKFASFREQFHQFTRSMHYGKWRYRQPERACKMPGEPFAE